jgi:hypothetical protein
MVRAAKGPIDEPINYQDPAELPKRKAAPDRIFWMTMIYKCDMCFHEETFYLEQGCEGPKVHEMPAATTAGHPMGAGHATTIAFTGHMREIVPVPFSVGGCPHCKKRNSRVIHVKWSEDAVCHPPVRVIGEPTFNHFLYPTAREKRKYGARACGRPVFATSQAGD